MRNFSRKLRPVFTWILRLLPLMCMAAVIIWYLLSGRELTVDDILSYSPGNPALAALFLWLAFALKSLSLMFPVLLLFAVCGRLFPLPLALLVNVVGISISLSLPYLVGRGSGADMTVRLMEKYPKLSELRALRGKNGFFFSFLVRIIGILPCDVVSLYLGNTRLPYLQYLLGGVLGFVPDIVCATVVGMQISDISSPWFWISIAINLLTCAAAMLMYRAYKRRIIDKKETRDA